MNATAYAVPGALALVLALTGAAAAGDMSSMKGMKGMTGMTGAPAAKHGQGTGVIKAIDAKAGTLTIQHGPIPAVSWPAMTMTFKARPATLLNGLKLGEAIGFDASVRGMDADVTAVRPK